MEEKKKKVYRNFARSEKAIIHAYVALMQEKGNKLSVTDIVNKADLNRSTFYAHFKSADDVLEKIHSDIINEITDIFGKDDNRNSLSDPHPALQHVLDFIMSDEVLYKMLLRTESAMKFMKKLENIVIDQYLSDEIILPQIKNRDEFEMNLRLVMGGFISVLQDWALDDIKVPLERVVEMLENSIKAGVKNYLDTPTQN